MKQKEEILNKYKPVGFFYHERDCLKAMDEYGLRCKLTGMESMRHKFKDGYIVGVLTTALLCMLFHLITQ
jgi:hypothetical protein